MGYEIAPTLYLIGPDGIVRWTDQQARYRHTDPKKLALLMALVALAIVWAGRVAADLLGPGSPKRKSHGYFAQSWFRIGFDRLRNLLASDQSEAVRVWRRLGEPSPLPPGFKGVV